jgi:hypothetical protein
MNGIEKSNQREKLWEIFIPKYLSILFDYKTTNNINNNLILVKCNTSLSSSFSKLGYLIIPLVRKQIQQQTKYTY